MLPRRCFWTSLVLGDTWGQDFSISFTSSFEKKDHISFHEPLLLKSDNALVPAQLTVGIGKNTKQGVIQSNILATEPFFYLSRTMAVSWRMAFVVQCETNQRRDKDLREAATLWFLFYLFYFLVYPENPGVSTPPIILWKTIGHTPRFEDVPWHESLFVLPLRLHLTVGRCSPGRVTLIKVCFLSSKWICQRQLAFLFAWGTVCTESYDMSTKSGNESIWQRIFRCPGTLRLWHYSRCHYPSEPRQKGFI